MPLLTATKQGDQVDINNTRQLYCYAVKPQPFDGFVLMTYDAQTE